MSIKNGLRNLFYRTTATRAPWLHSMVVSRRRPDKPVDPRVRYPSYKSLDDVIDVERLRGLDGRLREQIVSYLREVEAPHFDTGQLKLKVLGKNQPGSLEIPLSEPICEVRYHDLCRCELWRPAPAVSHFPELMDFIASLPFEDTGRILILCDPKGHAVTPHRDHYASETLHEFVWFRSNLDKPFFVQSWQTKERLMVASHTAWFDTVNQYHGADAFPGLSFSIRVDGRFTDEFRARIPKPPFNAASTPSLWASLER